MFYDAIAKAGPFETWKHKDRATIESCETIIRTFFSYREMKKCELNEKSRTGVMH